MSPPRLTRPPRALTLSRAVSGAALTALLLVGADARAAGKGPSHLPDKEEADVAQGLDRPSTPVDRSTPRRAWAALLEACAKGSWERAEHVLNLGEVPLADRKVMGAVLARQLCEVLATQPHVPADGLEDTPIGPILDDRPRNFVVVATLPGAGGPEEVWLRRFRDKAGSQQLWLLTRQSVSQIPAWYRRLVKKETSQRAGVEQLNQGLGARPALELGNPRAAMTTFLTLTRAARFGEAAHVLDLSGLTPSEQARRGARLARRLAIVLRQLHPGSFARLSNDAQGAPEKDVPFDEENVSQASLDGSSIAVRLARYPGVGGSGAWLFSAATVADVDPLYARFGYGWVGDHLPQIFFEWQLLGVQLWQWVGMAVALVLAMLFGYLAAFLVRRLLQRLTALTSWTWDDAMIPRMRGPLAVVFGVVGFLAALPVLALGQGPHGVLVGICKLLAILSLGWFLVRVIDVIGESMFAYFKTRGDDMGMAMVPVTRKILKPIIVFIVIVLALQNVGMNVGGLLAGLGIGGLAFALAGKNTIENLFGSIVISFDRPFKIGDFIKVGDLLGTVEDLGLRSTRIRTLERTVITVPNAQMADAKVENLTRRDRMRLFTSLGVQYDTSMDQLRFMLDELKRYLLAHPRVWQESFSARFVGFGASSLNLEVNCWVTTADWNEFTGIREQILMDLGGIVERAGAVFAFPSQTVYTGEDTAADAEKAARAAATVEARRQAGELCLPEIPAGVRTALQHPPETPATAHPAAEAQRPA